MSSSVTPTLSKWPFFLCDIILVGLAAVTVYRSSTPLTAWEGAVCVVATIAGAWFCALPFVREYQGALKLAEADALATTVAQINNLEQIKNAITNATGQWQAVHEHSTETVKAAREITDRMKAELGEFCVFLQKAHDTEKNHLKLEAEKLRRGEREWLQATVHILDHVFALHTAASRSGQPALLAQLNQFQAACGEAVRRLGLVRFAPALNDAFEPRAHQLEDADVTPDDRMRVTEVLALGYTYQGELVRRALVRVRLVEDEAANANAIGPNAAGESAVPLPLN
jgi:molecular chaperone GrpE (heat shock protein)